MIANKKWHAKVFPRPVAKRDSPGGALSLVAPAVPETSPPPASLPRASGVASGSGFHLYRWRGPLHPRQTSYRLVIPVLSDYGVVRGIIQTVEHREPARAFRETIILRKRDHRRSSWFSRYFYHLFEDPFLYVNLYEAQRWERERLRFESRSVHRFESGRGTVEARLCESTRELVDRMLAEMRKSFDTVVLVSGETRKALRKNFDFRELLDQGAAFTRETATLEEVLARLGIAETSVAPGAEAGFSPASAA